MSEAYPGSVESINRRLGEIKRRYLATIERAELIGQELMDSGVRTPSVVTGEFGVTFSWHVNGWDAELSIGMFDEDNDGPTLWAKKRHETAASYIDVPLSNAWAQAVLKDLRHSND